jgi:Amidohydrolase
VTRCPNRETTATCSPRRPPTRSGPAASPGLGRAGLARLRAAGVPGVTLNAALLGVEHDADAGPQLAALDMIVDVQVVDDQLLALGPLLDRAEVRVVVDHCGGPDPRRGLRDPGFQELLRRGREGRAVVKLSGLYKFSQRPHPHEDAWPFLHAPARIDYGARCWSCSPRSDDSARRAILWDTPLREYFPECANGTLGQ